MISMFSEVSDFMTHTSPDAKEMESVDSKLSLKELTLALPKYRESKEQLLPPVNVEIDNESACLEIIILIESLQFCVLRT